LSDEVITLRADGSELEAAIEEFGDLLALPDSELDVDGLVQLRHLFRKLFAADVLEFSNLIRVDSLPAADGTGDVLVSFHPSELFLELLSALRAGDRDNG
jgi:hypothetical protein